MVDTELAARLAGTRTPRWLYTLLDENEQPIKQLTNITGGTITLSANDRLGGDAAITFTADNAINFMKHRVLIEYDPGINGVDAWPLGVFLFTTPKQTGGNPTTYDAGLLSKMVILEQETTRGPYQINQGDNLIAACMELINNTGETSILATLSPAVARDNIVYPTGEPVLTIINDLLEAANYWGCHVNGAGQYVLAPYDTPAGRTPTWAFNNGDASIIVQDWRFEQDLTAVPNRVEVYTPGSDTVNALYAVAENTDATSPFSYQSRGRWITRREQVEAATQTEADQQAARLLLSSTSTTGKINMTHAPVPIWPRNRVTINTTGLNMDATIQTIRYRLEYDTQAETELDTIDNIGGGVYSV